MRRSLTVSEEFNVWKVEVDGRTVQAMTLVDALAKAAVTSPHPLTMSALGGTQLSSAAETIKALLPVKQADTHGPAAA